MRQPITTLTLSIILLSGALAHAQEKESSTPLDDTQISAYLETLEAMFTELDANGNQVIAPEESQGWIFSDLLIDEITTSNTTNSATITQNDAASHSVTITKIMDHAETQLNNNQDLIDPERYQETVLERYADGQLKEDEIKYMSGENVFAPDSEYIDPNLNYANLLRYDMDDDGIISTQELLLAESEEFRSELEGLSEERSTSTSTTDN